MSTVGESSSNATRPASNRNTIDTDQAGDHQDGEGSEDRPPKSSEQAPVDGKKLNEILELLRSQLGSQQRQLDLLQGLSKSVVADEAPTLKPTPTRSDYIRAEKWMNNGFPDSVHLKELGENFLKECAKRYELWFLEDAPHRARHVKPEGETSVVMPPHRLEEVYVPSLREQQLLTVWPESLGKLEFGTGFVWDSQLRISDWKTYNGDGSLANQSQLFSVNGMSWISRYDPPGNRPGDVDYPVDKTRFGEVLVVTVHDQIKMDTIAFIAWRLSARYLGPGSPEMLTRHLLNNFASDWALRQKFVRYYSKPTVYYTVRYFKYSSGQRVEQIKQHDPNSNNVPIVRDRGTFERAHKATPTNLEECRISLALAFDRGNRFPCFTVIILADEFFRTAGKNKVGLRMNDSLNPLHVFIRIFDGIVQQVCRSWTDVVKGLDQELSVKFRELFDDSASKRLMFDDNSFSISKTYFQMQQLCRMFGISIQETMRDIEEFGVEVLGWVRYRFNRDYNRVEGFEREFEGLSSEWDTYTTGQISKLKVVLELVQKKREEVESLRDGCIISERSSQKHPNGQNQHPANRYIFVFTVTTVIYLPLSFVTSVFGMHLFDTMDQGVVAARSKFYITITILSVATYAAAFAAYWLVRTHKDGSPAGTVPDAKDRQDEGVSTKVSGGGEKGSLASGIPKLRNHASLRVFGRQNVESKKGVVSDETPV